MTEDEWLENAVKTARSVERLELLAEIINDDKRTRQAWTQNAEYVDRLREAWKKRRSEIQNASN